MTMATVAYNQGTIPKRFWTALRLCRSKGLREANNPKRFQMQNVLSWEDG
jgi:hypothetical protein